jgi:hypothetical protein
MRQELTMTEYRFHRSPNGTQQAPIPTVNMAAEPDLRGAANALRQFVTLGCDATAPLAHVDMIGPDGVEHRVLVEEIIAWLRDPKQAHYVHHEGLDALLR